MLKYLKKIVIKNKIQTEYIYKCECKEIMKLCLKTKSINI